MKHYVYIKATGKFHRMATDRERQWENLAAAAFAGINAFFCTLKIKGGKRKGGAL